ncbi:MAG TPA: hypothetical protein PKD73_00260 [Burkholderiaceae bacterium]|nr:hypothetical protein [Burkholderiaceae bacterium]
MAQAIGVQVGQHAVVEQDLAVANAPVAIQVHPELGFRGEQVFGTQRLRVGDHAAGVDGRGIEHGRIGVGHAKQQVTRGRLGDGLRRDAGGGVAQLRQAAGGDRQVLRDGLPRLADFPGFMGVHIEDRVGEVPGITAVGVGSIGHGAGGAESMKGVRIVGNEGFIPPAMNFDNKFHSWSWLYLLEDRPF